MMERTDQSTLQRMFFYTRLPAIVFPLATAALLWLWGRRIWGAGAGLLLAALYALEPTALGHGALIKNDVAATCSYLAFWFAAWSFWRVPTLRRAAVLGGATLLAVLSKLSMLWLCGVAPVIAILAMRRERPTARAIAALALLLLIPYLGALTACQFETRRISAFELHALAQDPHLPKPLIAAGHIFRILPMPVPLWDGVLNLFRNNDEPVPVYFLGNVYPHGHPLYFLTAVLVKSSIPVLLLAAGGALLLASEGVRRLKAESLFWIAPGLVYVGLASLSSLQLGVRLVLPALPFALLIAGAAVSRLLTRRGAAILLLLFLWGGCESVRAYPDGLSFFNLAAGGPDRGLRYLADSNLDWGQGLPELARYIQASRLSGVRLAYFGNDSVWRFFDQRQIELLPLPWGEGQVKQREIPLRGGYYAVSATLLPGQFFPPAYRDYLRPLRQRKPTDVIAHSIYVYRLP
jgi:hypothetical protein